MGGRNRAAIATARMVAEIGRVTNTVRSPWLIATARSARGLLGGRPHPRAFGAFPRILGRYVRERKMLSLEEAVRKMT